MERLSENTVKDFIFGGNALITLESQDTGCHLTYKMLRSKNNANLYFVKSLRGADNTKDYVYIGCYFADTKTFVVEKSYKNVDPADWPKSIKAAKYLFDHLDNIPPKLRVYHNGRCCKCGRILTSSESIKLGIGPECFRKEV